MEIKNANKWKWYICPTKAPKTGEVWVSLSIQLSPMPMAAVASSTSLFAPFASLRPNSKLPPFSPTLHLTNSKDSTFVLFCTPPKAIPPAATEQQVLQAIAESDDKTLPCVRTYENDLSQLTLVGAVDSRQAVTAAAADGGQVASEHIDAGMDAMVVETLLPSPSNDHSTVSTRLVSLLSPLCFYEIEH